MSVHVANGNARVTNGGAGLTLEHSDGPDNHYKTQSRGRDRDPIYSVKN